MTSTQVQQPPTLVALPSIQPSASHDASAEGITVDHLAIVFETFLDRIFPSQGLLLLDQAGQLIQNSPQARQLCSALTASEAVVLRAVPAQGQSLLPAQIHTLVQGLIESRELFPNQSIQLQDQLTLDDNTSIHIQAEWIDLGAQSSPCIVVTLEDLTEVTHQRALFDAYRYHFTPRETEVWELHLQGLSYRQISEAFFISLNTVKRHMKSIYGKRREEAF
ncbi:MAG: helix-turn-helix transcriptional regulator [Elainellaceae cyanobacterium]